MAAGGVKRAGASAAGPQVLPEAQSVLEQSAAPTTGAVASTPSTPPPWEMLRPLAQGAAVAHGWRVSELSGIEHGTCVLTLENERGRTHRIHLCRNDGRPQGLVFTAQVDLVVMNGGRGDQPTEEGLAQAIAKVAHVLAANEGRHAPTVAALMPQAERAQMFAASAKLR
jgi:hypothetical protein